MNPELKKLLEEINERERDLRIRTAELFTRIEGLLALVRTIGTEDEA